MYDMTEIKRWVKAAEIYNKWIKNDCILRIYFNISMNIWLFQSMSFEIGKADL